MAETHVCGRCILDSSIPNIWFDEAGICSFCKLQDKLERENPTGKLGEKRLNAVVKKIKATGEGKDYDCLIGVSGGVDSTYCLYLCKKLGLRPLAVHFDNGWNSEIAVRNIRNATDRLGIDLQTYVVDWEEFKDLQLAFLRASTPDSEIPTDTAIRATLYKVASQEGIKYIIDGHNFRAEGKIPPIWSYGDGRYIESIYKLYGKKKGLKTFPNIKLWGWFNNAFLRGIKHVRLLYFFEYDKSQVKETLEKELGWSSYGEKHYESIYTRFFQAYILPRKFGIDKRILHLSALIRSGQISREEALLKMREPPISEAQAKADRDYVVKKLGITDAEFEGIMNLPPKTFMDYPTYYNIVKTFRQPLKLIFKFVTSSTPPMLYEMDYQRKNEDLLNR
jgi:N-acetyl sugar amidotransferase